MILLSQSVRIYVSREPVSLRKSFEGLSNEVRSVLAQDPLSGHLFLFLNKAWGWARRVTPGSVVAGGGADELV
jgi:hypothetical protein